jgi:hypothetical protein
MKPQTSGVSVGVSIEALAEALAPQLAKAIAPQLAEELAKKLKIPLLAGDDCLLTPAETEEFLNRAGSTLELWRSTGVGPRYVRLGSRGVAYRLGDLRAYVNA